MNTKLALAIGALCAATLSADIAPTQFAGTNAFPLVSTEVRMSNADVHIVWGQPCTLEADFSLMNESGKALDLEIGFPVGAYHPDPHGVGFEDEGETSAKSVTEPVDSAVIAITLNGDAVAAYRRMPHERLKELKWHYASWYFALTNLRSGLNQVHVLTKLSPSGVSGLPYKRHLSYCIGTGGRWKGPIGRERVEITFPKSSNTEFVTSIKPETGKVDGHSIQWTFAEIEPVSDEYDIELEFLLPSVAAKLAEIKGAYEREPDNSKAALRYAIHLFCLGWAKGNSGFPPQDLTDQEYHSVLEHTTSEQARRTFTQYYVKQKSGSYEAATSEWTSDRVQMVQILADAGFSDLYPEYSKIVAARSIVEKFLARDPNDAEAWAVYLNHFWRFSFAARGHWFGRTVYSVPLRQAIESAYKHCPRDERIKAWHDAMMLDGQAPSIDDIHSETISAAWKNEFNAADPN